MLRLVSPKDPERDLARFRIAGGASRGEVVTQEELDRTKLQIDLDRVSIERTKCELERARLDHDKSVAEFQRVAAQRHVPAPHRSCGLTARSVCERSLRMDRIHLKG